MDENLHRGLHVLHVVGLRVCAGFGCGLNSGSDGHWESTGRYCRTNCPTGQSRTMGGIRRRLAAEAGTAAGNRAAAHIDTQNENQLKFIKWTKNKRIGYQPVQIRQHVTRKKKINLISTKEQRNCHWKGGKDLFGQFSFCFCFVKETKNAERLALT